MSAAVFRKVNRIGDGNPAPGVTSDLRERFLPLIA
jgi:hypothetical protein